MKLKDKFGLAVYNLTHRKKTSIQCIIMMSIIIFMIFIFSFTVLTLTLQMKSNLDKYVSTNCIEIRGLSDNPRFTLSAIEIESLTAFNSVNEILIQQYIPYYLLQPANDFGSIILDGITYNIAIIDNIAYETKITINNRPSPTFAQNAIQEFSAMFPNEKLIKYGRDIESENEVLVSEKVLKYYNLTAEQILCADSVSCWLFSDAKVVGLINDNYDKLGLEAHPSLYYVLASDATLKDTWKDGVKDEVKIFLTNYTEVSEINLFVGEYFSTFVTRYYNSRIIGNNTFLNKVLTLTKRIVFVLFAVIALCLFIFMYSIIDYSIKQKGNYYGLLRAIGMRSMQGINFLEIVILSGVSAAINVLTAFLAIMTIQICNKVLPSAWGVSWVQMDINILLLVAVLLLSFVTVFLISAIMGCLIVKKESEKTIYAALRT